MKNLGTLELHAVSASGLNSDFTVQMYISINVIGALNYRDIYINDYSLIQLINDELQPNQSCGLYSEIQSSDREHDDDEFGGELTVFIKSNGGREGFERLVNAFGKVLTKANMTWLPEPLLVNEFMFIIEGTAK